MIRNYLNLAIVTLFSVAVAAALWYRGEAAGAISDLRAAEDRETALIVALAAQKRAAIATEKTLLVRLQTTTRRAKELTRAQELDTQALSGARSWADQPIPQSVLKRLHKSAYSD